MATSNGVGSAFGGQGNVLPGMSLLLPRVGLRGWALERGNSEEWDGYGVEVVAVPALNKQVRKVRGMK